MDLLPSGNDGTLKKSHRRIQGRFQSGRLLGREAELLDIPGYRDVTPIHEGTDCHVFRAHWEQGDRSVVLKLLDKAYPQPRDLFRYRKEYEILSLLAGSAHTVKAFALEELGNNLMLVLARKAGYKVLKKNWALERRRQLEGRPWRE